MSLENRLISERRRGREEEEGRRRGS